MSTKTLKLFNFMDVFDGSVLLNLIKMSLFTLISGIAGSFATFVTGYVWDSAEAVNTLLGLMVGDWVFGMWIGIKCSYHLRKHKETLATKKRIEYAKRKFSLVKAFSILFSIVVALWILSVAHNLSKANIAYGFLPGFVYFAFTGAYLISAYRKVTYLGFFSKDFLEVLEEKLHIRNWTSKKKDE